MADQSDTELIASLDRAFVNSPGYELGVSPGSTVDLLRQASVAMKRLGTDSVHIRNELRGLMDSLDEHVTHEDIYSALHELWKQL